METSEAAGAFTALSQETRLDLVRLLLAQGASGLPAGEIATRLGIPSSTLSFHLAALERAGLTLSTRQGRQIVHAVRINGLRRLLAFLTEACCSGRPELCGDLARLFPPLSEEEDKGMTPAFNVLFLCTHNSARSIMAEAILQKIGGSRFHAYSAGSDPIGAPLAEVVERLKLLGHDVGTLRSKSWNEFIGPSAPRMDFVITLCDTLHGQICPDFGELAVTGAWPLPDPAKFSGSPVERATMLNELYASLRRRIEIFTALPFASLDRMAIKARLDEIGGGGLPVPARGGLTMRVGINGMGRIGRLALRAAMGGLYRPADDPRGGNRLDVVHVNELKGGAATTAHLLEFDSIHGRWRENFGAEDEHAIVVGNRRIGFSAAATADGVAWGDLGCDVVLECTGKFLKTEQLDGYFARGVKRVIVAAPVKEAGALNIVVGVNDHLYEPRQHRLLTAASCTTNCLAPVVKVLHEGIGIRHGQITTIHDPTNTNVVIDAPHKDLRRARSAMLSLSPTTTGSATAIALIYPELRGKLNGHAVRAPVLNASLTDCVFEMNRPVTEGHVNELFRNAAGGPLAGILGFEARPLVSADYANDTRSAIVDGPSTMVTDGTLLKVYAWYDNEVGYACRMVDLATIVSEEPLMSAVRNYAVVTASYWGFTLTDGAIRMLVLLHFYSLGYTPFMLAFLFLLYETAGIFANLGGGWLATRFGIPRMLMTGLTLQIVGLLVLSALNPDWGAAMSVAWVVGAQGIAGVAKDITKTASKSAIKATSEGGSGQLFKWVAWFTGSKNAMKGAGFFVGGLLLETMGFRGALWLMAVALAFILAGVAVSLPRTLGKAKASKSFRELFAKTRSINLMAAARVFLFGSRDVWFVVGLPVFLYSQGWRYMEVAGFIASWTIGYGLVQAVAPSVIRRSPDGLSREVPEARLWGVVLTAIPLVLAIVLQGAQVARLDLVVTVGLGIFGFAFAVISSLHSYLILAYAGSEKAAEDVGFYYAANAGGRLVGILLSGLLTQMAGLAACLWGSTAMLGLCLVITFLLPTAAASRRAPVLTAGD